MRTRCCIVLALMCVAGGTQGAYEFDFKEEQPPFTITVTATNLTIGSVGMNWMVMPDIDDPLRDLAIRRLQSYAENNEALVLTPTKRARLYQRGGGYTFTPVTFRDNLAGFRIRGIFGGSSLQGDEFVRTAHTNTMYLALSDTPVEVGEEDVEMIMEAGEWVKYGKPQPGTEKGATASPVKKGVTVSSPSSDDGQGNAQSKPNNLWLYVAISLCFICAILYFLRRKLKT